MKIKDLYNVMVKIKAEKLKWIIPIVTAIVGAVVSSLITRAITPNKPVLKANSIKYVTNENQQGEIYRCIRKGNLLDFIGTLEYFIVQVEAAGPIGSKDIQQVINNLKILNTSVPITPELPLADFLIYIVRSPTTCSMFKVSIRDIATMSRPEYNRWLKDIKGCLANSRKIAKNSTIWYYPPANERDKHTYILENKLPWFRK